jgi:hypothetical protein
MVPVKVMATGSAPALEKVQATVPGQVWIRPHQPLAWGRHRRHRHRKPRPRQRLLPWSPC